MTAPKLTAAVESYFTALRVLRDSGGATDERSLYPPLSTLLNAVGDTLKPRVHCVSDIADQGAGHPDFGLYTAKQAQRGRRSGRQNHEDTERPVRHSRENGVDPSAPHPTPGSHPSHAPWCRERCRCRGQGTGQIVHGRRVADKREWRSCKVSTAWPLLPKSVQISLQAVAAVLGAL